MRTFTLGTEMDRKLVMLEVDGMRVAITEGKSDGTTKRSQKELKSEDQARSACEKMARELIARGYVEQTGAGPAKVRSARPPAANGKPTAKAEEPEAARTRPLFDDDEDVAPAPAMPRLATAPAAEGPPKKKKKKGGRKKAQKEGSVEGLDKRVVAGAMVFGLAIAGFLGFLAYDTFLKPATIFGTWQGSRLEYEIGSPMSYTQYRLILDEKKRASMTLQQEITSAGTYAVRGDRLTLTLKDEEGQSSELQYKIALGHSTLDLFDPTSGKKLVQLVRLRETPRVGGGGGPPPAAPKDLAAKPGDLDKIDKAADARLASVEFTPKDGAFKVRYAPGWTPSTGSRPDNSYSWAKFAKGSAKVQVLADVQGSLMSGSDIPREQGEEGSPSAPVHTAHVLYKKTVATEYNDYTESEPILFKGAPLGEGRISTFTGSEGGLFGSKLRGYRVTLLTNDRRVTILCHCPEAEFAGLKPTFLAICRSVSR